MSNVDDKVGKSSHFDFDENDNEEDDLGKFVDVFEAQQAAVEKFPSFMLPQHFKGNNPTDKFIALKSLKSLDQGQSGPLTRRQSSIRAAEIASNKMLPNISVDLSACQKEPSSYYKRQESMLRRHLEDMESKQGQHSIMLDYGNPRKITSIGMVQPTHSLPLAEKVKVQINLAKVTAVPMNKAFLSLPDPNHESKEEAEPVNPASLSQADPTNEDSSFSLKGKISKKRAGKAVRKSRRRKPKTDDSSVEPVNEDRIRQALAEVERRPADQPRRGRKPQKEDQYLSESLKRIDELELKLEEEKDTLTPKERDTLRNQSSALRSRVNRKLEARVFKEKHGLVSSQLSTVLDFIANEMTDQARASVLEKMTALQAPTKRARKATKVSKSDFQAKVMAFVIPENPTRVAE